MRCRCDFLRGHLLKIQLSQTFIGGSGLRGVNLDFGRCAVVTGRGRLRGLRPVQKRLGGAFRRRFCRFFFRDIADCRQHQRHHMFQIARITPVKPENLVEDLPFFGAVHENRMQRPVEIRLAIEPCRRNSLNGQPHPARPDGQARAPQGPREMGDIVAQFAILGDRNISVARHGSHARQGRCPSWLRQFTPGYFDQNEDHDGASAWRASSRMRLASSPCRRAMSS